MSFESNSFSSRSNPLDSAGSDSASLEEAEVRIKETILQKPNLLLSPGDALTASEAMFRERHSQSLRQRTAVSYRAVDAALKHAKALVEDTKQVMLDFDASETSGSPILSKNRKRNMKDGQNKNDPKVACVVQEGQKARRVKSLVQSMVPSFEKSLDSTDIEKTEIVTGSESLKPSSEEDYVEKAKKELEQFFSLEAALLIIEEAMSFKHQKACLELFLLSENLPANLHFIDKEKRHEIDQSLLSKPSVKASAFSSDYEIKLISPESKTAYRVVSHKSSPTEPVSGDFYFIIDSNETLYLLEEEQFLSVPAKAAGRMSCRNGAITYLSNGNDKSVYLPSRFHCLNAVLEVFEPALDAQVRVDFFNSDGTVDTLCGKNNVCSLENWVYDDLLAYQCEVKDKLENELKQRSKGFVLTILRPQASLERF